MAIGKALMAAVKAGKKAKGFDPKKPDTKSRVLKKMQDEKGFQKKLKKVKDAGVGTPDGFTTQEGKDKALERVYKEFYRSLPKNLSKRLQKAKDAQRKNNPYRPPEARKAGGKMKSKGYKAGGKMKSKGYAGGGKVKQEKALELKKKAGSKTTQNKKKKTTKPDLFGDLILGSGYRMGQMPGNTFKAGGKVKSKGYKAGGKMKSKGYKAGGKMKKKPQSGHNRLY